jgi:hypothetical protein
MTNDNKQATTKRTKLDLESKTTRTTPTTTNDTVQFQQNCILPECCSLLLSILHLLQSIYYTILLLQYQYLIMIRSCRIPSVLNRVCDASIQSALLVTNDGELLGASTISPTQMDPETLGTLIADIAMDYRRLGEDMGAISSKSQCLLLEMEHGLICVTSCIGIDCMVIAIAQADAPPGMVKAKLQALAVHVQEGLSLLTETN